MGWLLLGFLIFLYEFLLFLFFRGVGGSLF
jgi:hypothetical protein